MRCIYANTTPFFIRDMRMSRFGNCRGSCMSQFRNIFFQTFHFLTAPRIAAEKFAVILFLTPLLTCISSLKKSPSNLLLIPSVLKLRDNVPRCEVLFCDYHFFVWALHGISCILFLQQFPFLGSLLFFQIRSQLDVKLLSQSSQFHTVSLLLPNLYLLFPFYEISLTLSS